MSVNSERPFFPDPVSSSGVRTCVKIAESGIGVSGGGDCDGGGDESSLKSGTERRISSWRAFLVDGRRFIGIFARS